MNTQKFELTYLPGHGDVTETVKVSGVTVEIENGTLMIIDGEGCITLAVPTSRLVLLTSDVGQAPATGGDAAAEAGHNEAPVLTPSDLANFGTTDPEAWAASFMQSFPEFADAADPGTPDDVVEWFRYAIENGARGVKAVEATGLVDTDIEGPQLTAPLNSVEAPAFESFRDQLRGMNLTPSQGLNLHEWVTARTRGN